ncbi:MAG TPA: 5-(carboxyamino)imidazole ribonucleotide synthase [Pseudogracilibacillus sp.]|nr:5-(carboxyamino)imidazole ribonucleotide synthase [Pseudogracilibacillus sp.]
MPKNKVILPPKTIGIIGGGQLGRMMAIEARYMGYKVAVLDPTKNCPTAQVADKHIVAAYDDLTAIKELTEISDVVTYEFENVDLEAATYIEKAGKLPQGAFPLEVTQNREREKTLLADLGLPVAPFTIINSKEECEAVLKDAPLPSVIKTCRGGYDGKGQFKVETEADFEAAIDFIDPNETYVIEQWISFDKEISVVFSCTADGDFKMFPIAENQHKDQILSETTAPAEIDEAVYNKAVVASRTLADSMLIVGTFTIEMFVIGDGIFINEMAPRPHNSGHYTIEACNISQFKQHIRAICGLPLTEVSLHNKAKMINVLGEDMDRALHAIEYQSEAFVHLYGKEEVKEKRKMGHVTFIAESFDQLNEMKARYEK